MASLLRLADSAPEQEAELQALQQELRDARAQGGDAGTGILRRRQERGGGSSPESPNRCRLVLHMSETHVFGMTDDQLHGYRGYVTACGRLRSSMNSGVADEGMPVFARHRR